MSLLLLHGFTGSPASWDGVLDSLASLEPIPLALPGHGGPSPRDSFERAIDDVVAQFPDGAHDLVGYSLGGRIALGICVRHPDRVERVTLIGAHPGIDEPAVREERVASDEAWAEAILEDLNRFVERWGELPIFSSQTEAAQVAQNRVRRAHDAPALAAAMRQMSLGNMPSYRGALAGIQIPVQLVTGSEDSKFTALAEQMLRLLPNGTHEVIAGAGHNVLVEAPEALSERIAAFHARLG